MTLKELVNCYENVNKSTRIMVYKSLDDYEWSTPYWDVIGVETASELNWKIAKFRIYFGENMITVAIA